MFIPKPGRNSQSRPKDFLLMTMERLVDRYLRGKALALMPLPPN